MSDIPSKLQDGIQPEIKPSKIVVSVEQLKNPQVASGYDSRIIPPADLPEEFVHLSLFSFFDMSRDEKFDTDNLEKLRLIREWSLQDTNSIRIDDMIRSLHSIETRMGIPPMGVTRLEHMHQFVTLDLEAQRLLAERDSYLK